MNLDTLIKLGESTSLLEGYKANICATPFKPTTKPALYETPVDLKNPDHESNWSWPSISLHENSEDLLSAILQIKLRAISFENDESEGGSTAKWPAGALILAGLSNEARQQALRDLSDQVGLDLGTDGWSYALVRRTRLVGTATHKCFERGLFGNPDPEHTVMPEALDALKALEKRSQTSTDVSMDGANGYLDFFKTFGSHFVSKIDVGDSLYQVFAFAEQQYKNVLKVYTDNPKDLSGPTSTSFALFTSPRNEAGYGYTAAIGTICIASRDHELLKSLEANLWLDNYYAGTNSIFAPYLRSDAINANNVFKKLTVISTELASLEVFAEYYRKLIWRRVFKGAMYSKFPDGFGVAPYFSNNCPYDHDDLKTMFKDSDPLGGDGLLSTIATPTVNIWQELIDPSVFQLQFPDLVVDFSAFANAIQIPSPSQDASKIEVPGSSIVSLIGHVISVGGNGDKPPNLCLSESAYNQVKSRIICGEFYGGIHVSSVSGSESFVIMNGLIFEENNNNISVVRDIRGSPNVEIIQERLTDFEFALVAAEARINFLLAGSATEQSGKDIELMKRFLLWLAGTNNQNQNESVAALQARAMYLANVTANSQGAGVPIPYLKYEAYKDVVNNVQNVLKTASDELTNLQNQIRERKAEERDIERETALNENIISSGKLLTDYISTQASYQKSLESVCSTVVSDKERELKMASKQASDLNARLNEQRETVEDAVTKYQEKVVEWQNKETLRVALDIASNIFVLGFTVIFPATSISAVKDLGETAQKVQKVVKVYDALIKAYRSVRSLPNNPQKVVDTLNEIGPSGLEMPTSLEWDEMKVNMDATLATGPDINAKTELSAAFSVLVLRGKALLESQGKIQEIAASLSAAHQQVNLHNEQTKRLHNLKVDLDVKPKDLDVANVDLIGLSGQLLFFQRQMLMILASTLAIQDRALQYEFLRPPTPIGSFTLLELQLTILNQSLSISRGLTVQPPPMIQKYPVIYEIHGVKPDGITKNQRFSFDIYLNRREFTSYNYVRVENVEVEIGGITSTKSGMYYTELYFDGNPFYDRGFNGEMRTFQTASRIYTELHNIDSSSHVFSLKESAVQTVSGISATTGQEAFGNNISNVTPFSRWQVSLPETSTNEDITFDDNARGITVRIVFHLFAQLKEGNVTAAEMHEKACQLCLRNLTLPIFKTKPESPVTMQEAQSKECIQLAEQYSDTHTLDTGTVSSPGKVKTVDVLKMMSEKSVCAGWDAVLSMTTKQVNEQLDLQFKDRQGVKQFLRNTGEIVKETSSSEGRKSKTAFNFNFNAPRVEFLLNNSSSAQVFMPIISGHYEYSLFKDDEWTVWEESDVKETDGSYIQGDVPLAHVQGSVSSIHNIAVKLNGGSFSAQNFEAVASNPMMSSSLTKYFTSLKDGYEVYNFGTLDFGKHTVLPSLTPTDFVFNVVHTASNRDILQVFIATTGNLQSNRFVYLQEPIPSQYECSLIINSEVAFKDVLSASLGDGGIDLQLNALEPPDNGNKDKAWSSEAEEGSISTPFTETKVSTEPYYTTIRTMDGPLKRKTGTIEYYVKVPDNTVDVSLSGMEFKPSDNLQVTYNKDIKYNFLYGSRNDPYNKKQWTNIVYPNKTYSLVVTVTISCDLPLGVSGSGQDQLVNLIAVSSDDTYIKIDGHLEPPAGFCECNDRDLQKLFLDTLKKQLGPKLADLFNRPFQSASLFALKNILFPAKNLIDMKEAHIPGDLVIFGNFTKV